MMLVDAHCHIDYPEFDSDREEIIKECRSEDIILVNSTVKPDKLLGLELAGRHENVYPTIGLTPRNLSEKDFHRTVELIRENRGDLVGLGEVGLDYYWIKDAGERRVMEERFKEFMELSLELKLPLVVHSRDAEARILKLLEEYGVNALLHCFSGTFEQALKAVELGCLISIPASIVYSKAKQELVRQTPLESLALESDAPFLAPKPKTRNTPMNIKESVEIVSLLKDVDEKEAEEFTSENAVNFYGIKIG
jgi:TatD DNase family protein